jgi:hypothetical protein
LCFTAANSFQGTLHHIIYVRELTLYTLFHICFVTVFIISRVVVVVAAAAAAAVAVAVVTEELLWE